MSDRTNRRPRYVEAGGVETDHRILRPRNNVVFMRDPSRHAEQFEMRIDGGFRLIQETGIDFDRIARENAAAEQAARDAEGRQTKLFE